MLRFLWTLIGLLVLVTIWLAWQNRASDKVSVNVPSALVLGMVGVLSTLLFSLKSESRSNRLPVEYVVDASTQAAFSCEFVPSVSQYSDPGFGIGISPAFSVLVGQRLPSPVSDQQLHDLYLDVLTRQVLDVLAFTYIKSWDAEVIHDSSPTRNRTQFQAATSPPRPSFSLDRRAMLGPLAGRSLLLSDTFSTLNLPPRTSVVTTVSGPIRQFRFSNDFAVLTLSLAPTDVSPQIGILRDLCRLPQDAASDLRTLNYVVTITAEFSALRSGHPEMPSHERWVALATSQLENLSAPVRWAALKDSYLLLYANRTESPAQQLMRETIARAHANVMRP